MSDKAHSARVRGTLDNPKTKEAMQNNERPPAIGDPGSLKAENTNTNPVPGNSNQDGGNVDLGRSSSSSSSGSGSGNGSGSGSGGPSKQRRENDATAYADVTGKKKAQSDATAYADGGRGGPADKEENKNFDPRKYRESIGKDGGGGENAGIEWSNTSKEGEKGVQNEKIEGVEWTEKIRVTLRPTQVNSVIHPKPSIMDQTSAFAQQLQAKVQEVEKLSALFARIPTDTPEERRVAAIETAILMMKISAGWLSSPLNTFTDISQHGVLDNIAALIAWYVRLTELVDEYFAPGTVVRYLEDLFVQVIVSEPGLELIAEVDEFKKCIKPLYRDEDVNVSDVVARAKAVRDCLDRVSPPPKF